MAIAVAAGVPHEAAVSDPDEHQFGVPEAAPWDQIAKATMNLGEIVVTPTTPTLVEGQVNLFTAPAGTILDPDTQYMLNLHGTGDTTADLEIHVISSNEQVGLDGWSIEDCYRTHATDRKRIVHRTVTLSTRFIYTSENGT